MTDHVTDDDLVALALDELEPAERARLSGHLAACGHCRTEYALVEDAVRGALSASPAIAPPPGFSGRVLTAMGLASEGTDALPAEPSPSPDAPSGHPTRPWWTPLVAAVAALVLGAGLGVAGTLALTSGPPDPVGAASGGPTSASALVTRAGKSVGTAGLTTLAGREYLVVTVTSARPGLAYECVTVDGDGRRTSVGTWTLDAAYGGPEASGTWVVPVPPGGVEQVELVTASGTVWSRAQL